MLECYIIDDELPAINILKSYVEKPPMVIFTTAYEEYALQGYELDIIDYLVKPIPFNRFLKAVNKAARLQPISLSESPKEQYLFVKADYQTIKIPLNITVW